MSGLLNAVYFILILGAIILIHELGHLIAAKKFNVYCREFSFGMGPLLWQKKGKETAYSIRLLPIGGFVSMAGEDEEADANYEFDIPEDRYLNKIAKWKQIIVMGAGAFMNIVLAFVVFCVVIFANGVAVDSHPTISAIAQNSAAYEAGFQVGDQIIAMSQGDEKVVIDNAASFNQFFDEHEGTLTYTILRNNQEMEIEAQAKVSEDGTSLLGITYTATTQKAVNIFEAIKYGFIETIASMTMIFKTIATLLKGIGLDQLSGPVGIFQVTAEVTKTGLISTLNLLALLSVNVGIMNLLPIPILDGGRIVILTIEAIIGRKLNQKLETVIMFIGLLMIVALMLFATWNDISRLLF